MRIAVAAFGQETSTFSPLPTTLDHFREFGIYEGADVLDKFQGMGAIGGFLKATEEDGSEDTLLPIIRGWAGAGGIVEGEVVDFFAEKIVAGLKQLAPIDGMYFSIHGAAQSDKADDAEGYLLRVIRDVLGPDIPIVCPMDHHANITQLKMDCMTGLVGHRTQPHDPFDTGYRAGKLFYAALHGKVKPSMAWHNIPIVTHQEQFLTKAGPMKEWFDMARQFEELPGVLSVSPFPMQPWLDAYEGGYSIVVVTDNDPALAGRLSAELANKVWDQREALWKLDSLPIDVAVRKAIEAPQGLVVLSDTGDTVWGGAAGDSTHILAELIRQQVPATALVSIVDAPAVEAAIAAGVGSEITVSVGATLDSRFNTPIDVTGKVAGIGGGQFSAEVVGLESFDMGRAVILEIGNVKLMISELRGIGGNHPIVYQQFGIDPAQAKMVVVKTSSNWQYYGQWISEVIRVNTPGPTQSHLEELEWTRIPRPTWPLDDLREWRAEL